MRHDRELGRARTGGRGLAVQACTLLLAAAAVSWTPSYADATGLDARAIQQDPATDLYEESRDALNRGQYRQAAELLARLAERHPDFERAGDAHYWHAYALYRLGSYERALRAVDRLLEEHAEAAARGDADALRVRIEGALARRGDAEAAERIAARAEQAAEPTYRVERETERALRRAELTARQAELAARSGELAARYHERALEGRAAEGQEACEEAEVQAAALNALLMMDADRALPILERVLARRDECSEPLRVQATWLLAQKAGDRVQEILLRVVREDPSSEVRGQAVFWLSRVEGDAAVAALEEILASEDDADLQNSALFALSRHPSERAFQVLREYALNDSKPEENRAQAVFWLSRHGEFADLELLTQLYGQLAGAELKGQVLHAVAQNAERESAIEWLLDRALDANEDAEIRKQALFWAGQAGVGIERLDGLYATLDDPDMKQQLVFVYSRSDEAAAVERLIEIARTETDPEIRKQAIFWLGRSDDPRAADFLVQLLETP